MARLSEYQQLDSTTDVRSSLDEESSSCERVLLEKDEIPSLFSKSPARLQIRKGLWIHMVIFLSYTLPVLLTFIYIYRKPYYSNGRGIIYSPAREAVSYEEHTYDLARDAKYFGEPSPEMDMNWNALLHKTIHMRISKDELQALGREADAVALPDGSGYLAQMHVYHELHCLNTLRRTIYTTYYWGNASQEQALENKMHADHCLDYLKQASMCHGDVGINTYHWREDTPKPFAVPTTHECVDWDRLDTWTRKRSVIMTEKGLLVHPTLGPAFPDGATVIHPGSG